MAVAALDKFRAKNRDRELITELSSRFARAERASKPFHSQIKLNLAFLSDRQWLDINPISGDLVNVQTGDPSWRIRMTNDKITPIYNRILGNFMQFPLTPEAVADSHDDQSHASAEAANHLAKGLWERTGAHRGVQSILPEFFGWMLSAGSSFLAWWWDPSAISESPTGNVRGDIRFGVPSPRSIFPDPGATSWDDMGWLFRQMVMGLDVAKARWPEKADELEGKEIRVDPPLPTNATIGGSPSVFFNSETLPGQVVIREYFERPTATYPKGRYIVLGNSGKVILDYREALPYGDIPMVKADFIPIPGAFWGKSLVAPLIPIQRSINEMHSRMQEIQRMTLAPKLLVPIECDMDEDAWTTLPSEKIFYSSSTGAAPVPIAPPNIPPYINGEFQRMDMALQEIASMHMNNVPIRGQARRTALEARLQQEQDDIARIASYRQIDQSLSYAMVKAIELCRDRYHDDRLIRVGVGDAAKAKALSGADLEGSFKVSVRVDPSTPFSRTERFSLATNLWKMGIFGKPGSPQAARQFMRFVDIQWNGAGNSDDTLDNQVAEFEDSGMKTEGRFFAVGQFDNHEAHLEIHLAFLKQWRMEPDADQARIRLLEDHILTHRQMWMEQQQQGVQTTEQAQQARGRGGNQASPQQAQQGMISDAYAGPQAMA